MTVVIVPTAAEAAVVVADAITALLRAAPAAVVGLAAGATPVPAYRLLRERGERFAAATVVLLDEYVGVGPDHPASFRRQVRSELTDHVGLPADRLLTLDGQTSAPAQECRRFEAALAALGGVELQLLGIGRNGHIAFNEPGSPHGSRTRMVELTESTRRANAASFDAPDAVPRFALTQGIGTILEARRLVLMATGAHKASAVHAAIEGPVTEAVPASALQRHPHVTYVLDEAAAARLAHSPPRPR